MRKCDRCGRKLGRRSWDMCLTSNWGTPSVAYLHYLIPAYRHSFTICEECAADLRKFMRIDERKCAR